MVESTILSVFLLEVRLSTGSMTFSRCYSLRLRFENLDITMLPSYLEMSLELEGSDLKRSSGRPCFRVLSTCSYLHMLKAFRGTFCSLADSPSQKLVQLYKIAQLPFQQSSAADSFPEPSGVTLARLGSCSTSLKQNFSEKSARSIFQLSETLVRSLSMSSSNSTFQRQYQASRLLHSPLASLNFKSSQRWTLSFSQPLSSRRARSRGWMALEASCVYSRMQPRVLLSCQESLGKSLQILNSLRRGWNLSLVFSVSNQSSLAKERGIPGLCDLQDYCDVINKIKLPLFIMNCNFHCQFLSLGIPKLTNNSYQLIWRRNRLESKSEWFTADRKPSVLTLQQSLKPEQKAASLKSVAYQPKPRIAGVVPLNLFQFPERLNPLTKRYPLERCPDNSAYLELKTWKIQEDCPKEGLLSPELKFHYPLDSPFNNETVLKLDEPQLRRKLMTLQRNFNETKLRLEFSQTQESRLQEQYQQLAESVLELQRLANVDCSSINIVALRQIVQRESLELFTKQLSFQQSQIRVPEPPVSDRQLQQLAGRLQKSEIEVLELRNALQALQKCSQLKIKQLKSDFQALLDTLEAEKKFGNQQHQIAQELRSQLHRVNFQLDQGKQLLTTKSMKLKSVRNTVLTVEPSFNQSGLLQACQQKYIQSLQALEESRGTIGTLMTQLNQKQNCFFKQLKALKLQNQALRAQLSDLTNQSNTLRHELGALHGQDLLKAYRAAKSHFEIQAEQEQLKSKQKLQQVQSELSKVLGQKANLIAQYGVLENEVQQLRNVVMNRLILD